MSMPKGFKSDNGYATATELGGKSYHQIAEAMTSKGFKMNHSTARNVCVDGLKKLAETVANFHGIEYTEKDIIRIAKDPRFQNGISDIIQDL
tara:strand:+ start:691 stop:966 length:276 start_codon:yes stop_codon:yes gene_type:complete